MKGNGNVHSAVQCTILRTEVTPGFDHASHSALGAISHADASIRVQHGTLVVLIEAALIQRVLPADPNWFIVPW